MGRMDCYCAFCGGPLDIYLKLGKRGKKYLAARSKRLDRKIRKLNGEVVEDSRIEDENTSDEENEEDGEEEIDEEDNEDGSEGSVASLGYHRSSGEEKGSYDPRLVSTKTVRWTKETLCLGFNPDANTTAVNRAWVGGGEYEGYLSFRVAGGDEIAPECPDADCYSLDVNAGRVMVFPYHDVCFTVFAQALDEELLYPVPDNKEEDANEDTDDEGDHVDGDSMMGPGANKGSAMSQTWTEMLKREQRVDKDSLYHALTQVGDDCSALDVDYGGIQGMQQTWKCISGEEYTVHCPELQENFVLDIPSNVSTKSPASKLDLSAKVRRDSFGTVPDEIMFIISSYLPAESIKSLIQASWAFSRASCDNFFWKDRIRKDILPWFWEIQTAFTEHSNDTNFRVLYQWLDHLTKPRLGLKGRIMPIANRRRIWKVCEIIKERYANEFIDMMRASDEEGPMELASKQMPPLMYSTPKASSATWTHWTAEFAAGPGQFESFWNNNGDLVGLALNMRSSRKHLGKKEISESGITKMAAPIDEGDTITGLILHISDTVPTLVLNLEEDAESMAKLKMIRNWKARKHFKPESEEYAAWYKEVRGTIEKWQDFRENKHMPEERCEAATKAITVQFASGRTIDLGAPNTESLNKRPLFVPPGTVLQGLSALTAVVSYSTKIAIAADNSFRIGPSDNGVLTRLGLIHSPEDIPDTLFDDPEFDEGAPIPLALRTLWHPAALAVSAPKSRNTPTGTENSDNPTTCPIWDHPNLIMTDYPHMNTEHPIAFAPHHALVWASDAADFKHIKRISVLRVLHESHYIGTDGKPTKERLIFGIRVSYQDSTTHPPRSIGQTEDEEWPESHTSHFDIDGPGGEHIIYADFCTEKHQLVLQTTRNRICIWRRRDDEEWWCPTLSSNRPSARLGGLVAAWIPELMLATTLEFKGCNQGVQDATNASNLPKAIYGDVGDSDGEMQWNRTCRFEDMTLSVP